MYPPEWELQRQEDGAVEFSYSTFPLTATVAVHVFEDPLLVLADPETGDELLSYLLTRFETVFETVASESCPASASCRHTVVDKGIWGERAYFAVYAVTEQDADWPFAINVHFLFAAARPEPGLLVLVMSIGPPTSTLEQRKSTLFTVLSTVALTE
jgi:hypothetical protein